MAPEENRGRHRNLRIAVSDSVETCRGTGSFPRELGADGDARESGSLLTSHLTPERSPTRRLDRETKGEVVLVFRVGGVAEVESHARTRSHHPRYFS